MSDSRSQTAAPAVSQDDLLALKSYVTARDGMEYNDVHQDTVVLDLTHSNLVQRHAEIRFDLHSTLETLRRKIHQQTGTPPAFQYLQIKSSGGNSNTILHEIPPDTADSYQLGFFGLQHGMTVHCVDLDPHSGSRNGQYEDTSLVQKYIMSDDEYDKRRGTLRDWERQQKQRDETFTLAKHAKQHRELVEAQRQYKLGLPLPDGFVYDKVLGKVVRMPLDDKEVESPCKTNNTANNDTTPGPESVQGVEVGMRCQVQPGGRRGRVAFVGVVPHIGGGGHWVGVVFDEPVGKTDGSVPGTDKRYFQAQPRYGGFVRGKNVQVGDYPERNVLDDLEDSSEDEL